jgi:hypothetical protein
MAEAALAASWVDLGRTGSAGAHEFYSCYND